MFDLVKIQEGLLSFRSIDKEQLKNNNKILRENYGKEAYYFIMDGVEFVTYGKQVEANILKEDFKEYFEDKFDNEYALDVKNFKPLINDDFTYRVLTAADADLVTEFKKQFSESELEYGSVSIEDPLVIGAFDKDKLIAVSSMWEWDNDLDDIGLIVDLSYRKQGVGASVVSSIIKEVINKKVCIYRADYDNPGSVKIAEKLGFTRVTKIHRYKG